MEAMAQHPEAFQAVLCYSGPGKLSSTEMTNLFRIGISERGSNRFNQETQVISYWYDYLQDIEDKLEERETKSVSKTKWSSQEEEEGYEELEGPSTSKGMESEMLIFNHYG
ncbi:hypothetical protein OS493_035652 [Desmophyllum pertusum]|uniref:Uncharacterized protein n=1 Tax=Desmophyllum pertusum TaxID=174260 RepID=A0A9W9Z6V3_9CNID|nr:hypothetical protein OS493_035652 [Desmophyllum pertusum]